MTAQFTVFRNPGRNAQAVPFVVQIQSGRLAQALGRMVMPLVRVDPGAPEEHPLTPRLTVQGQLVYADPLDLATLPAKTLAASLGVLAEEDQDKIMRALDEMVSRA